MEDNKMKVEILRNVFSKENGTYDKEKALSLSGKIAGICYNPEGFKALENESEKITNKRIDLTLNNKHHSVYDHLSISFNLTNIPKILAMVLNNEKQYTTSEKSGRYTAVVRKEDSVITLQEELLYNKWMEIFKIKIKSQYGHIFNDSKIEKLAQENSRYLVTVFMPTTMIYTTSLRQINYIAAWMDSYIGKPNKNDFENKLSSSMSSFIDCLMELNVYDVRLQQNEKNRSLSLFAHEKEEPREFFGDVYSTTYKGSLAQLAQAHRHRTIDYDTSFLEKKEYYIPPILIDDPALVSDWEKDMLLVAKVTPQGEMVKINENGSYINFLLKAKERLCSAVQLEICDQTRETLLKYKQELEDWHHPLHKDMDKYTKGARCTFPDYTCTADCRFPEGKTLRRKI